MSRSLLKIRSAKHNARMQLTLAVVLMFVGSTALRAEWVGDARPMMGTEVSVHLWHEHPLIGEELVDAVFAEASRIDRLMSTYIDASRMSDINRRAADEPVVVGDELFQLIRRSLDISVLTHGAFDITYDSVGQHYDFRSGRRPDDLTVEEQRKLIDYRFVELEQAAGTVHFKKQGVRINLGGIAKGYVVERGIDILRTRGVDHAIVTAGGDSRLLGDRRGRPWMVGIRDPRDDGQVAISVPLVDEAISTSGDYERYFEEDGVRYHHILQPATGEPATGTHSASVFGPDAVITDALSTSVFVLGVDQGLRLIATLPDYESIVIDADGRIFYSDGLQRPEAPSPNPKVAVPAEVPDLP